MSEKKYLDVRVIGYEPEINEFITLIAVIQELGRQGASRDIQLSVDGDGSGRLKFQLMYKDEIKDIEFIENFNPDDMPRISIGE